MKTLFLQGKVIYVLQPCSMQVLNPYMKAHTFLDFAFVNVNMVEKEKAVDNLNCKLI